MTYLITSLVELLLLRFRRREDRAALLMLSTVTAGPSTAGPSFPSAVGGLRVNRSNSFTATLSFTRLLAVYMAPYLILAIVLTGVHIAVSTLVPQPWPCPRGYLGPGGIHQNGTVANCTGGVARQIDEAVFTQAHMYQRPTSATLYHSQVPFDPEGLLGMLTSLALCLLGVMAGRVLSMCLHWPTSSSLLSVIGVILVFAGLGLCGFSAGCGFIPINKNLWSASYIFVVGGASFLLLAALFLLIDAGELWSGAPLRYAGKNSILLYVGHEMLEEYFPVSFRVPRTHAYQLTMNTWSVVFWIIVSYFLYRKKIFLSV